MVNILTDSGAENKDNLDFVADPREATNELFFGVELLPMDFRLEAVTGVDSPSFLFFTFFFKIKKKKKNINTRMRIKF